MMPGTALAIDHVSRVAIPASRTPSALSKVHAPIFARAQPQGVNMHSALRVSVFSLVLFAAAPAMAQLRAPTPPPPGAAASPTQEAPAAAQAPGGAPQQIDPLTREFRDCIQKAQAAMQAKNAEDLALIRNCLTGEVKRQEARFSQHVSKLTIALAPEEKKKLDAANSAWRRYRDANCAFYGDPAGVPPLAVTNAECTLKFTVDRALELERLTLVVAQREQAKAAAPVDARK